MSKRKLRGFENALMHKRSRQIEKFNLEKYKLSIMAAGLDDKSADRFLDEVHVDPKDYFSSAQVHQATYKALLKKSAVVAANYNIPNAIYALGPTGYPFEVLCAEMLSAKGYQTEVSVMKRGKFIDHEVDVVAQRDDGDIYFEAKFHNRKHFKNDVKVALYVYSRYLDIQWAMPEKKIQYAIISNTAFSKDAIKFARGVGMILIAMNYPHKDTFIDHIRRYKIYPVTVMKSLKKGQKRALLEHNIVTVKQLSSEILEKIGVQGPALTKAMQEARILTRPN